MTPEKRLNSASLHQALAGSAPRLSIRGTSVLPKQTTKWRLKKKKSLLGTSTEVVLKKVPGTKYCTQWKTPQKSHYKPYRTMQWKSAIRHTAQIAYKISRSRPIQVELGKVGGFRETLNARCKNLK